MKHKTPAEEHLRNEEAVGGPGAQLRLARERKGIELSKVAAQLHLSQAKIRALEQDEYEKLSSPVFVQGYLRNYARLLGVDEDAVIRTYQELHPSTEEPMPLPRNQPDDVAKELHSNPPLFRLLTWAVVIALGMLLFVWLQSRLSVPEVEPLVSPEQPEMEAPPEVSPPPVAVAPEPPEPAPVAEPSLPLEPAPVEPISLEPEPVELLPPESVPLEPPSPEFEPAGSESAVSPPSAEAPPPGVTTGPEPMPAPETGALSEDEVARPTEGPVTLPTPAAESAPPVSPLKEGEAGAVLNLVEFEFSGPCWVEVRDANGRARIFGEMRAGVRRSLGRAPGPFGVVIGDVNAASLTVNGKAFDMKPFARGKVARFTLDPSRL